MTILRCLAIILTALALVPAGAHLFALPNKIGMPMEAYFTVQSIYSGWALLGIVLLGALFVTLVLAVRIRHQPWAFRLALLAFLCLAANLAIFFLWTYPANQATDNWTMIPQDWQVLRKQWELSHAVNAILTFGALCAVTLAGLLPARDQTKRS